jgi:hypothetical protein
MLTILNNSHYSSISRLGQTSYKLSPKTLWVKHLSSPLNGDIDTSDENYLFKRERLGGDRK